MYQNLIDTALQLLYRQALSEKIYPSSEKKLWKGKRIPGRADPLSVYYIKQSTRHYIKTVLSLITQKFPKSIHAVIMKDFLLKVSAFVECQII